MYEKDIKELIDISNYAGSRADYTQGGGGNTSVKFDADSREKLMAIKASGYRLIDIIETDGFVPVDYGAIKRYYETVLREGDHEAESVSVAKSAVRELNGLKPLRPSVEVGFHSILKKYVIHTHSVYGNLVCCAEEGESLAREIFASAPYGYIFLPYITPGFTLTLKMNDAIKCAKEFPKLIFMRNHGIVVTSDSLSEVKAIHEDANERIREYFSLKKDELKCASLREKGEDVFESATPIVREYLVNHTVSLSMLDEHPLYPDQLVYLNNTLRLSPEKMTVESGKITYHTQKKEALVLEETLAAYLFVISKLSEKGCKISVMAKHDVDFINNWEVEKFRRSQAK